MQFDVSPDNIGGIITRNTSLSVSTCAFAIGQFIPGHAISACIRGAACFTVGFTGCKEEQLNILI